MKSDALAIMLSPFKILANRHALSPVYRTLELTADAIRGCSSFAFMEVAADLQVKDPIYVDALTFLSVVDSLPPGEEVKLRTKDSVLHWSCGAAKGKLATVIINEMPRITRKAKLGAWPTIPQFAEALELGSLSCDSNTLSSIGMYGIVIDNRNDLTIYSCDNVTISACVVMEGGIDKAPDIMTLPPEGAQLLSAVMKRGDGKLEFGQDEIFFRSPVIKLLVKQVPELKQDISELLRNFAAEEAQADVPPGRIAAFIKRVGAIAENSKNAHVTMNVDEGRIALSFSDGTASSDEYYLVEGLGSGETGGTNIHLNANKLARALLYVQTIVLDHLDRNVIVLRGSEPDFRYLVSGKANSGPNVGAASGS